MRKPEILERAESVGLPAHPSPDPGGNGAQEELAKVRDILLGTYTLEFERKLAQLHQQTEAKVADLRADLQRQVGLLERQLQNEANVLTEQLRSERQQREAGGEEALGKLSQLRSELEERMRRADAQGEQAHRDLRDQILSQTNLLAAALEKRHQEATRMISEGLLELRSSKTDGATLSSLLTELANRLQEAPRSD